MVTPAADESLDLLVVGGGPGGYTAALHAAHLGRRVTLVDRRGAAGLGGVCLHEGCIPTKALLEVATQATDAADWAAAGLRVEGARVDLAAFQQWKDALLHRLAGGVARLLEAAGVEVVAGAVELSTPTRAVLTTADGRRQVAFTDAILAPGSRPLAPPGLPVDDETVLDSSGALALTQPPAALAVVGGGPAGVELGTAFAKLGSSVTIVEQAGDLLPMVDPVLVRPLRRRLRELGVDVLTHATVVDHDAGVALVVGREGERRIPADVVLVGVGRRPATAALTLHRAGIDVDAAGFVSPGPGRLVSPHIAAVGDITPGPFHAHKAAAEARVAADVLCGGRRTFDDSAVPFIAHGDPEIASVGLTITAASTRDDVRVVRFPLTASGWATAVGSPPGYAVLVVEKGSEVVVGVHLVGPSAVELIGEGALAVATAATVDDVADTVHAHPTLSEQLAEVASLAAGMPVHVAVGRGRRGAVIPPR